MYDLPPAGLSPKDARIAHSSHRQLAAGAHGYEIKSYRGSRISLMTPTPDGGYQGEHTFREFMERYGRAARKADGSVRFTGTHRVGRLCEASGLTTRVRGYDPETEEFNADVGIAVELFHPETGEIAASWSLGKTARAERRQEITSTSRHLTSRPRSRRSTHSSRS